MARTKEDVLRTIVEVATKLDTSPECVTAKMYEECGELNYKTVYARFKGLGWAQIALMASNLDKVSEEDSIEEPSIDDFEISIDIAEEIEDTDIVGRLEAFDLEKAMLASDQTPSSLGMPKIHEFTVKDGDVIFGIPDIHSPWLNMRWLVWIIKSIHDIRNSITGTVHVVQLGDALDIYGFSKHEKTKNVNPVKEIELGTKPLHQMWEAIGTNRIKRYQLIGNHDTRSEKFCLRMAPQLRDYVPTAKSLLTFKDVFTADNEKDCILFKTESGKDEVLTMHGIYSDSLMHCKKFGTNVLHGHLHSGSDRSTTGGIWALCAGWGGDTKSWAFAYSPTVMKKDWPLGAGRVDVKGGRLHPAFLRFYDSEE